MQWTQPWNQTRERELEGAWNTQTYVEFMDTPRHLYRDEFESSPKYADRWVYIFYLRNAIEASVGCGVPFFMIWALHGFHQTMRITLMSFFPFAIVFIAFYLVCAYMVTTIGHPLVGQMVTTTIV